MAKAKWILSDRSCLQERFIPQLDQLTSASNSLKQLGFKVVLISGVYDLLDCGQADRLEEASRLGDVLMVGVHSDAMVFEELGYGKPFVPQLERVNSLIHLRSVGLVTLITDYDHWHATVEAVRPDIMVVPAEIFSTEETLRWHNAGIQIEPMPESSSYSLANRLNDRQQAFKQAITDKLAAGIPVLIQEALDDATQKRPAK